MMCNKGDIACTDPCPGYLIQSLVLINDIIGYTYLQSYKRIKGAVFASNQDGELSSGIWTELETIMLVVIQEILFLTDLPSEPANITSLYQFIAASEYVTEIKLPIVKKEAIEVEAKLQEMVAKQQLMLAGLNPETVTVSEVEMATVSTV